MEAIVENAQTSTIAHTAPLDGHSLAFASALLDFRACISEKDIEQCEKISSPGHLQIAIKDIEKDQAKRNSLRNMAKIRPLLEALGNYSNVIEVFVNANPDLLAFIWGPIKLCLQVCLHSDQVLQLRN
jgi:hypothetical protein